MSESLVQVTEGSGKKLHTDQKTIGANNVEDEYILHGEPFLSTYVLTSQSTSIATANDHVLCLNAGASLNVYVRRITVYQTVLATTAALTRFQILKTTTAAPTGGTVRTPITLSALNPGVGATGMTLPTVKATEGGLVWEGVTTVMQTAPTAGISNLMFDLSFDLLRAQSFRIASGTTNGMCFKVITATAAASVTINITFSEANY